MEKVPTAPAARELPSETAPLYTRYCAAPTPSHPIGEPRLLHSLQVAAWVGRLVGPLPPPAERRRRRP